MKIFLKPINSLLVILLIVTNSFSCGYYPMLEEYRISNFDSNLLNFSNLNAFCFTKEYLNEGYNSGESYNFDQNINQWYVYCNHEVSKNVIRKALFELDTIAENSVLNILKKNKKNEAHLYLTKLLRNGFAFAQNAKKVKVNSRIAFESKWDFFEKNDSYQQPQKITIQSVLDAVKIKKEIGNIKDPFVRKRYAYQAIIEAYYKSDITLVHDLFNQYFKTNNKTWLDNSAQHYFALVSKNTQELLLDCFIHGFDKQKRNIELLYYSDSFDEKFASRLNDTTRSYYYTIKNLKNYGRGLDNLKKIQQLNPKNRYFDFLVNREINKIEDWLLVSKLYKEDCYQENECEEEDANFINYTNDKKYAMEFLQYIHKIKIVRKNQLFYELVELYLKHLLDLPTNNFDPEKYKKVQNQYIQARLIDFYVNFDKKIADKSYQKDILFLYKNAQKMDKLRFEKNNVEYCYDENKESCVYMRMQMARNMGAFMTQFPKVAAEGFLLEAKSYLPHNQHYPFFGQNLYLNLYSRASNKTVLETVGIIESKSKSDYHSFITQNTNDVYAEHYLYKTPSNTVKGKYDIWKLYDVLAQKLVCVGKFEQALSVYKKFPKVYWQDVFGENPFNLNFYNLGNPLPSTKKAFNKLTFLEQLIHFQKQHKQNPKDPYLNYYLGNAYFSMTSSGGMWYMSKPFNFSSNRYGESKNKDITPFIQHYKNAIKYSKSKDLTATASFALKYSGTLPKNFLNQSQQEILESAAIRCDIYNLYLSNLQTDLEKKMRYLPYNREGSISYFSNLNPPLVKFKNFDDDYLNYSQYK